MSAINDSMKEFEYKTDLSSKKRLKPYHTGKPQYKEYFNYRMDHLNFFCQFKDRVIKTLSYYCDFCDLMVEDKDIWDNHNQMKHPDCNELIIYCSTCSMFIIGPNSKEHSNTIEHSILLKLLDLFQQTKNLVTQNTEILSSIFNDTSINQETNEEFELSIREISKEVLEFQCGDNNGSKNNDGILHTVKDNGKGNPDKMSMSNCDQNYTEKFKNEDVPIKNNSLLNFPSAMPHCSKDLTIQNKCNSEDVSTPTEDLIFNDLMFNPVTKEAILEDNMMDNVPKNEVSSAIVSPCSSQLNVTSLQKHENTVKFDEDNAYGEYVTQRLKQIENSNAKNDIKLEIDNIFYIKIKQSTL